MTALADIGADLSLTASPAKFANNLKLATMAAVKSELGSKAGVDITNINAASTISISTAAAYGKVHLLGGASSQTLNLINTGSVPDGTSIVLINTNAANGAQYNILAAGAQTMRIGTTNSTAAIALMPGDAIELTTTNGNWSVTGGGGSAALAANFAFSRSLNSAGYQKFPGGLIIQWGTGTAGTAGVANNFPIAFPSGCVSVAPIVIGSTTAPALGVVFNGSGAVIYSASGSPSVSYVAIGY